LKGGLARARLHTDLAEFLDWLEVEVVEEVVDEPK
jgi:hypothetical protein